MTKRERLIAYGLKRGFLSEEDAVDLLEDSGFCPDGYEEVDRKPGFFDNANAFFCEVRDMAVNIAKTTVAEMLVDALLGMTGKTAIKVRKGVMKYLK